MQDHRNNGPGSTATVRFSGSLSVGSLEEARRDLLAGVDGGREIRVEFGDVSQADLSFVQLLIAATRSAAGKGTALKPPSALPGPVRDVMAMAGMANHGGCAGRVCFWCAMGESRLEDGHEE